MIVTDAAAFSTGTAVPVAETTLVATSLGAFAVDAFPWADDRGFELCWAAVGAFGSGGFSVLTLARRGWLLSTISMPGNCTGAADGTCASAWLDTEPSRTVAIAPVVARRPRK
jgi:hypothetical protein